MASINLQGDTSGAITISAPSVAGSNTLTLPATTQTLATQNALGVRNLIINGDMRIAQRSTSESSLSSAGYHTVDRWNNVGMSIGTWTISQSTEVPSGQGFSKSLKYDCTTAESSPAAGDQLHFSQRLEGQMLQHLKKGTSSAEKLTLSFWVRSNKTGTYQTNLRDKDNTRIIGKTYTIDAADTWEKKTLTFDGDTTGSFDNDNGNSLEVEWFLGAGSTYTGGSVPTAWEAENASDRAAGLSVNVGDSTSNDWYITGVQLEVGDTATPFEHRPYDMELARCQRYYYHLTDDTSSKHVGTGYWGSTTSARGAVHFPVQMRTLPSVSYSSGSHFKALLAGVSFQTSTAISIYKNSEASSLLSITTSGGSIGQGTHLEFYSSPVTTTYLGFSAEL